MSHRWIGTLLAAVALPYVLGQPPGVINPLAQDCGPPGSSVVCINKYTAVLPYHFNRSISNSNFDYDFRNTADVNATSFRPTANATFLVFDKPRQQFYWGAEQRVSLRTLDPATNKTNVLLNNYFGAYFNTIDNLTVHPKSREIFFTNPDYSWFNALTDTAPQLPTASYRFNPDTGATIMVDDTIQQPNGIAFSPDGSTLYISDTGAVAGPIDPKLGSQGTTFNTTGQRTIYAYDVSNNGTKISNKRPFYLTQDWVPDGLKVSQKGLVVTGDGRGVDVLDDKGQLLIRVQTNYTVQNFEWTGEDLKTLWLMGQGGIRRVQWNITGQRLT